MKKNAAVSCDVLLDDLLAGFPHPAVVLDEQFSIVTANSRFAALTGFDRDGMRGVYAEFVLRSNIGNQRGQIFQKAAASGETQTVDGDIINRSRQKIPVRCSVSRLRGGRGCTGSGLLLVVEDLTGWQCPEHGVLDGDHFTEMIGHCEKMQAVFAIMPLLARTEASILITGETGTGKDKVAEIIHRMSSRNKYQFIKLNCGALPPELLESELFGHVKGAFTGAFRDKPGMFKMADKGTIFLTEIGDMPLPLQVKLLTVLDDQAFYPVGSERLEKVDVRVIAATHRSLRERVDQGLFREDLFYRLNVLQIHLPPLREREGDIRFLLDHFLLNYAHRLGKQIKNFAEDCLPLLQNYSYPGNIRELRNIVEYAANVCRQDCISRDDLPEYIFSAAAEKKTAASPPRAAAIVLPESEVPVPSRQDDHRTWPQLEREMILQALQSARGNRARAAEILGCGRTTLWRKIARYGLA